ncbi:MULTISPECIES: hypothetical protein [Emticicia]|uniref:hypothetical protein n=1 Tax=Emticicia TaxID=312278 RepID=UPI000C772670|nr:MULTISPECIES: hypothetical protein [Emticicia]PLK45683.1 hypothetical protein C0V77_06050 [Emticicia sp. TH156]UTA69343.1 hypothetical protein MB380_05930 [Emticicia sp. 21SJ11W-3]
MAKSSAPQPLPSWFMLVLFILIMTILWVFGDLFVFILGLLVVGITFANGYNRSHADEGHH